MRRAARVPMAMCASITGTARKPRPAAMACGASRIRCSSRPAEARSHIEVRTWERGAGLTKACGSAACAVAVAAARLGRATRDLNVTLPGGDLHIEWRARDDHVLMTGPVQYERQGRFDAALFKDP